MPPGEQPPVDGNGMPMRLLAQINFAQMPELPGYPTEGLLQIFIAKNQECYGADIICPSDGTGHESRWWAEVVNDASYVHRDDSYGEDEGLPITGPAALTFREVGTTLPDYMDYEVADDLEKALVARGLATETDAYGHVVSVLGSVRRAAHQVGGYPSVRQADPRPRDELWLLLLGIGEDDTITWGDGGLGNFFIRAEDLKARDFSRLLYYWDCF